MLLALRQPPERLSLGLKFRGCVPVAPQRRADSDSENSESDFARLRLPSVGLRSGSHGFAAETLVMPLHWPPLDFPWQLRYPPWLPRDLLLSALAPHCALPWTPHDLLLGRVMKLEAVQFRLYGLIELVPLSRTCASARRAACGAVKQCPRPCSLQVHDGLIDMWLHLDMNRQVVALFSNLHNGLLRAKFQNHDVYLRVKGTARQKTYCVIFLGCLPLGCQANGCSRESVLLGKVLVQCCFPASAFKPMFRIGSHIEKAEVCFHCLHALCVEGKERWQKCGLTQECENTPHNSGRKTKQMKTLSF